MLLCDSGQQAFKRQVSLSALKKKVVLKRVNPSFLVGSLIGSTREETETGIPSDGSSRRARRPCLELLCTNMLSETAST